MITHVDFIIWISVESSFHSYVGFISTSDSKMAITLLFAACMLDDGTSCDNDPSHNNSPSHNNGPSGDENACFGLKYVFQY